MSDQAEPVTFHFSPRISQAYSAQFVRRVGLFPLTGVALPARFPSVTAKALHLWRARIQAMAAWPVDYQPSWVKDARRVTSMLNCPPPFLFVKPQMGHCQVKRLCPFCWALHALDTWQRLDRVLFPTADGKQVRVRLDRVIVLGRRCYPVRPGDGNSLAEQLTALCGERQPLQARLRRAGAFGGLSSIWLGLNYVRTSEALDAHHEQFPDKPGLPIHGWNVDVYDLVVTTPADKKRVVNALFERASLKPPVTATEAPKRRWFMSCVAQVLRYPRAALYAPPRETRDYLAAVAGKRLTATFGEWHG